MDPRRLREATRPEHEATEAAVPLMTRELSRDEYVRVLQRFFIIVAAWDNFAAASAPAAYAELVAARRRSASLQRDLQHFGSIPQTDQVISVQAHIEALVGDDDGAEYRFLGAMYVLEGSTLGGRFIAEHAEEVLGLTPGEGDAFFRGYGEHTIPMWREFQAALVAAPEQHSELVITAAKAMFALFQKVLVSDAPGAMAHPATAELASY